MKKIIVQVNHPGGEKAFNEIRISTQTQPAYYKTGEIWTREWNRDNEHYRKLLLNKGRYLNNLDDLEQEQELLFWGEWEAASIFKPLKAKAFAYGIHTPILTLNKENDLQNTDPYVFGKNFKYAICSQSGVMTSLDVDSLILFGTTTNKGFMLDTVFVVKESEEANKVFKNKAENYTSTYKNVTLDKISDCYLTEKCKSKKNRIYIGKSWTDDKSYFSFVPCKPVDGTLLDIGMEKLCIPFDSESLSFNVSRQKVGHPYSHFINMEPKKVWNELVNFTLNQGYKLGTFLEEPTLNHNISIDQKESSTKSLKTRKGKDSKICY